MVEITRIGFDVAAKQIKEPGTGTDTYSLSVSDLEAPIYIPMTIIRALTIRDESTKNVNKGVVTKL